jgi:hypothetical protein
MITQYYIICEELIRSANTAGYCITAFAVIFKSCGLSGGPKVKWVKTRAGNRIRECESAAELGAGGASG